MKRSAVKPIALFFFALFHHPFFLFSEFSNWKVLANQEYNVSSLYMKNSIFPTLMT